MWIVGLLLLAFAQQEPEVVFRQKEALGWNAIGDGSEVHGAGGGMAFTYDVAPKKLSGIVIGAPQGFARMSSIRFAVKTDYDTAIGVLLSEKKPGGGNYAAWFWSPANVRQQIELTPADFSVTDGAGDPVDADGKLDLDQVEGVGIFDLAQFFLAMPRNPQLPLAVTQAPGKHTAVLEDFTVLSGGPSPAGGAGKSATLDAFDRGFLNWVSVGGMKLELSAAGNPLGMRAMRASYRQQEGQLSLMLRRVSNPALAKAKRLSFDIASDHDVTLMVALEMKRQGPGGGEGPRFTLPIYPPGGKEVFHVDLDLADFKGPSGKFDPAQWRSIAILDATSASGGPEGENTIWIGNIEARD